MALLWFAQASPGLIVPVPARWHWLAAMSCSAGVCSFLLRHLDKLACHLDEFGNKLVSPFVAIWASWRCCSLSASALATASCSVAI